VFVRGYYAALNERRFGEVWASLAPVVRARFGGFEVWKRGYGRTISSSPSGLAVVSVPGGATVTHLLVARDKGCGRALRFRVTWRLRANSSSWTVNGLSAVAEGVTSC
jgi:hypothetical protein